MNKNKNQVSRRMILWPPWCIDLNFVWCCSERTLNQKIYDFGGLFRGFVVWMIRIRIKNKNDLNKIRIRLSMNKIFSSILFQFLETSDSGFEGFVRGFAIWRFSNLFLFLLSFLFLSFYLFICMVQRFYFCSDRTAFTFCSYSVRASLYLDQLLFILHSDSNSWNSNIGIVVGFRLFLRLKG